MADTKGGLFSGDASRLFLLLILYTVQGMPIGFLLETMPIMLKKYYSYTDIGILAF